MHSRGRVLQSRRQEIQSRRLKFQSRRLKNESRRLKNQSRRLKTRLAPLSAESPGNKKIPQRLAVAKPLRGNKKKEVGRTISRVLYGAAPPERAPRACHLSARNVAVTLYRSTLQRARAATRLRRAGWTPHSDGPPSDVGLHELSASDVHSAHVAVRLVSSYLTFSPLPCPRARMAERNRRFFSSARVHPCGRLPIKKQIALCCPDFPPAPLRTHAASRPADFGLQN